ncbi:MAG: hypothetical protein HY895_07605 [Deltaproteobacteria bacterium]|nr:hypothetical protein [Deltaproteobacteria bacterium]
MSPLGLLIVWEMIARLNWVDPFFLPAPRAVWGELQKMVVSGEIFPHIGVSLARAVSGYRWTRPAGSAWI